MEKPETIAHLTALHKALGRFIESHRRSRFFDPPVALEFFERWAPIRDHLRAQYPQLLADLPQREPPASSGTTDFEGRGYVRRQPLERLHEDMQYVVDVLTALPSVSVPSMKVTREGVFFAGQYFDAFREISELIKTAKHSVSLVDGYASSDTLAVLSSNSSGVEVRILTRSAPPALRTAAQAFNKQFGGLDIRLSQTFHDRFLILDDKDVFHLGASIKDLGHRGFMFSRVEEPEVLSALKGKFENEWSKAQPM